MSDPPFVRLFGGPLVVAGTSRPALSPAQRRLLAIVYADAPDPVTREEVCWLLWNEGESAETRHRIRQLIYEINRPLPTPALERDGDLIVPCLPTDVNAVEPSLSPPLRLVTDAGNASFEHWLDTARARLENHRRRHFAAALDTAMQVREWHVAFSSVGSLIATAATPSTWFRQLIQTAIRSGSTHQARAIADELVESEAISVQDREALETSLFCAPDIEAIADDDTQLLGRERELAWLQQRTLHSTGIHFSIIRGRPGIGKTRLVEELALWAAAEAETVALIRMRQSLAASPFSTAAEILTRLNPTDPLLLDPTLPLHSAAPIADRRPQGASRELTDALRAAVSRSLPRGRTILLLDDAQWIDPTSLHLLQNLFLESRDSALSVLLTVRIERGHNLPPRLASFARDVRAEAIDLTGLDASTCEQIVRAHVPPPPDPSSVDVLFRLTHGNPLALIDLARGWAANGWHLDAVPNSLITQVDRIIDPLGTVERLVLSVIAAMDSVSATALQEALQEPVWDVAACLSTLVDTGLIAKLQARYQFRHAMLRDAAMASLGVTMQSEAHMLVAEWLAGTPTSDPSQVVFHYRAADAHDLAGTWALDAARSAATGGALIEATRFYEFALEAEDLASDAEVVAEAGRLAMLACRFERGSQLLARASSYADNPDSMWEVDRLDGESEAGIMSHATAATEIAAIASDALKSEQWVLGFAAAESAIRVMERGGEWRGVMETLEAVSLVHPTGVEASALRGMLLALGSVYGSPTRAGVEARAAFNLLRENHEMTALLPRAAHRLFVVLLSEGRVASNLGRDCLEILRGAGLTTGSLKLQYSALANEAVWHLDTGNLDQAGTILDRAESVVRGSEARNELQNLATNRGYLNLQLGQPDLALEYFENARELITPGTRRFLSDVVRAGIGLCHLRAGRLRNAELQLEEVDDYDFHYFDPTLLIRLAVEISWRRGRRHVAVDMLKAKRLAIQDSFVPQYLGLTLFEARLRTRLGDSSGSLHLADEVATVAAERGLSSFREQAEAVGASRATQH